MNARDFAALLLVLTAFLAGCTHIQYCGGTDKCCTLTDVRDKSKAKSFCVDDERKCKIDHKHQAAEFPSQPGLGKCDAREVGQVPGPPETRFAFHDSALFASIMTNYTADRRIQLVSIPGRLNCDFLCSKDSPLCTESPLLSEYGSKVNELANLVKAGKTVIPKAKIMAIFDQQTDHCDRANIIVREGHFSNEGQTPSCVARISANLGTTDHPKPVHVDVHLPKVITGTLSREANTLTAYFDVDHAPLLQYNGDSESLYSGPLTSIAVANDFVLAGVGTSCLRMNAAE